MANEKTDLKDLQVYLILPDKNEITCPKCLVSLLSSVTPIINQPLPSTVFPDEKIDAHGQYLGFKTG
jgi:hypothetical protein